jgi:hypothetical protein
MTFKERVIERNQIVARKQEYEIVTLCGSMRYYPQMLHLAEELTAGGCIVLMPYVAKYRGGLPADATKRMLDDMHMVKIDMADRIIVIGAHIGESTSKEIEYAKKHLKPVNFIVPAYNKDNGYG